jgi:hypothetical protein
MFGNKSRDLHKGKIYFPTFYQKETFFKSLGFLGELLFGSVEFCVSGI